MAEQVSSNNFWNWRNFFKLEASGIRTSLATVLPLIISQIAGYPAIGLFIGLSGLYLSVSDKEGSTVYTLTVSLLLNAAAMYAGTILGNEVWLSIFLLFLVAFIGGMMEAFGEIAGQMGYVTTLVFSIALGQAAGNEAASDRFFAFLAGGAFCLLLTLLLWAFDRRTSSASGETQAQKNIEIETKEDPLKGLWKQFTPRSIIFRHALRLAVASTIAIAVYKFFRLEHGYWLIITVLVIVKPIFADTRKRALERILGSVAGGILALIIAMLIQNIVVLDILLTLFSALAFSHVRTNYGFYALFLTPFVVLMIDTVIPGDWKIALIRILDTILGGAIALTVSYLLRPRASFKV
jgi:Fusaric acid resistance protein-like